MKAFHILTILFLFFQSNYAQQISPMFISSNNDKVWNVLEINSANFLITKNKYYNTPFYELNDSLANELIIYNTDEDIISSKIAISKYNFTSSFSTLYNKNTSTLINISTPIISPFSSLLITELDLNLNILNQREIQIDSLVLQSAILTSNGNVLIAGVRGGNLFNASHSILVEANASQGLVNFQNLSNNPVFFPTALAELNNKYFLYSHGNNYHIYDQQLNLDTIINFPFPGGASSSQKSFILDSKMYLNGINSNGKYEIIFSIDTNYIIDTILINPYPSSVLSAQRGYFCIDGNEDGFLFNSNTIGICPFYNYNTLCENHIPIRKVDTSGVLQWEYYFGGDATYLVYQVTATQDGGCIVVFDRYEQYDINEDVYYIKFDSDGNVEEDFFENINTYTSISKLPKPQQFLIYPNPVEENINIISSNYKGKYINIYNNLGQLIQTNKLSNSINFSMLIEGNYFYTITDKNQEKLQEGKFLKK